MTRRVWLLGGTGNVGGHVAYMLASEGLEVATVSRRSADRDWPFPHVSLDLAVSDTVLPVRAGDVVVNLTDGPRTHSCDPAPRCGLSRNVSNSGLCPSNTRGCARSWTPWDACRLRGCRPRPDQSPGP